MLETYFLEWFDAVWKVPPNEIEDHPDSPEVEALAARMDAWLDMFERLLGDRDYLLDDFSAADCVAFPFLKYARRRPAPRTTTPFTWCSRSARASTGRPSLAAWIERMDARPQA